MSVSQHECGGCGTVVRRDDSPLATSDQRPRRMVFTDGGAPVYTVDLCNVCFDDAQQAARDQLAHVAERKARLAEPEEATVPTSKEGEHEAVIEGSNEGHAT